MHMGKFKIITIIFLKLKNNQIKKIKLHNMGPVSNFKNIYNLLFAIK